MVPSSIKCTDSCFSATFLCSGLVLPAKCLEPAGSRAATRPRGSGISATGLWLVGSSDMALKGMSRGAELLYRYRDYKRLSQAAMALAVGTHQSRLSKWERGLRAPGLRSAVLIERFTGGMVPCGSWIEPLNPASLLTD